MSYIRLFTRTPGEGDEYPSALAYSIHMEVSKDGNEYEILNQNYGILFAEANIRENNTIDERGAMYPVMAKRAAGGYGFCAHRVDKEGNIDEAAADKILYWKTEDMEHFTDVGLISYDEAAADLGADAASLKELCAQKNDTYEMEITEEEYNAITRLWIPIYNTGVEYSENLTVSSAEDIKKIKVKALYSDGSYHDKYVSIDDSQIDFTKGGTYTVKGVMTQPEYKFPLAEGYADPIVFFYEGKWYFIATNDNTDDVGLFVRGADTIDGLFAKDVEEHVILDYDEEKQFIQTFWAPEFHMIGGSVYILFAVGPKNWGPHSHMMKLKEGGNILNANDWETPVKVVRKDGSPIEKGGITLDMTYLKVNSKSYLVWSERYHIGTELDSGSMIYIAETTEETPYKITTEPMLLTRPLYGWEHQYGTINNEGPYPLVTDNKVHIAYSGGSAGGYSYVVANMTADINADLLDINSWTKSVTPLLSAHSVEGEYGPGHNGFYKDENGDTWITYHAKLTPGWATRSTAIRRVHFDVYGDPVYNMSKDRDIDPKYKELTFNVTVK